MDLKIKMQASTIISLVILVAGLIFYIGWSLPNNAWTDIGVYSLTIILVVSGILGLLLSIHPKNNTQKEQRK
jgi:hypothetical protein